MDSVNKPAKSPQAMQNARFARNTPGTSQNVRGGGRLPGHKLKPVVMTAVTAVVAITVASFVYFRVTEYVSERYRERQAANVASASGSADMRVTVSDDELASANKAAGGLIACNYTVLELFYLQGLPHLPGPYNQTPEDGYFEVDSASVNAEYKTYTTLAACESLVNNTYTPEKASQLLLNPRGYGALYVTKDGRLGVNAKFVPVAEYDVNWADISYTVSGENVAANGTALDFTLDITLKKTDGGEYAVRTILRRNADGGYRLTELIK
ncbi:hypothetical protein FACS1894133_1280 [Clostridia bacterium]|nr:hypothetical protein FACS1894133_1280 [Clostridia bacterium]